MKTLVAISAFTVLLSLSGAALAEVTSLWSGSLSAESVEDWGWCKVGYDGATLLENVNGQAGTTTITGTLQFTSVPSTVQGAFLQLGLITKNEYLRAENPSALGGDFTSLSVNTWAKNNNSAGIMLAQGQWYSTNTTGFAFDYSGAINGGAGYLDGGVMNTQGSQQGYIIAAAGSSLSFTIILTPSGSAGGTMDVTVNGTLIADNFAYGTDNWKMENVDSKYWLNPENFTQSYLVANMFTMTDNMNDVVTASFTNVQASYVPEPATLGLLILGGLISLRAKRN